MEVEFSQRDIDVLLEMAECNSNRAIKLLAQLLTENSEVAILVEED